MCKPHPFVSLHRKVEGRGCNLVLKAYFIQNLIFIYRFASGGKRSDGPKNRGEFYASDH